MKEIAIASGKGGTGKTSIVASFANFANAIIADCDVDAPNLHLILDPEIKETILFEGMKLAEINEEKCIKCGRCEKECRFNAIEDFKVIENACEGCAVCKIVCPENAIRMKRRIAGRIYVSKTRFGEFVYGLLSSGETSGKLVSQIRQKAREISEQKNLILIDSPAGIGCPVIASITNTDMVVIVAEPSLASLHDMYRIITLTRHFGVKTIMIINKYDINEEITKKIEEYCAVMGIEIVGKIPFSKKFVEAMVNRKSIVEYDYEFAKLIEEIWKKIEKILNYLG